MAPGGTGTTPVTPPNWSVRVAMAAVERAEPRTPKGKISEILSAVLGAIDVSLERCLMGRFSLP